MTNLNYKIQDWFELRDIGVIVSFANPEFDKLSDDEIRDLIGKQVIILDTNSQTKQWAKVFEIEIVSSIIDKKNVSISLGNSIKLLDIKPNSDIIFLKEY